MLQVYLEIYACPYFWIFFLLLFEKVVYMKISYASRIVIVCAELLIIGPFSPILTFNMVQHYRFLSTPSLCGSRV